VADNFLASGSAACTRSRPRGRGPRRTGPARRGAAGLRAPASGCGSCSPTSPHRRHPAWFSTRTRPRQASWRRPAPPRGSCCHRPPLLPAALAARLCAHQAQQADSVAAALRRRPARPARPDGDDGAVLVAAEAIDEQVVALGLDPVLAATLLRYTLFPSFRALNETLARCIRRRGTGVIAQLRGGRCGGVPGVESVAVFPLRLCAAGWEVPRLFCPYCGCRSRAARLPAPRGRGGRFGPPPATPAGGMSRRSRRSQQCRRWPCLLADVATLHLDLAAAGQGYSR